jgi:indolepyruvate ferredoxin oxidoreductase alpha subunit
MCPFGAIEALPADKITGIVLPSFDEPPAMDIPVVDQDSLPQKLSLAIRGVGGQGNLFFGKVLTQVAFLAGYATDNIVKGETHGMAQMGGPVISTFSCGKVHSAVLVPGTVDCLIAMEMSELLRPGFLELLKKDGIVLSAATVIKPQNLAPEDYPDPDAIRQMMEKYRYIELDILSKAVELGDTAGRSANVVMIGALSTLVPFSTIPVEIWLQAIKNVSPIPLLWAANYHAFMSGRDLL